MSNSQVMVYTIIDNSSSYAPIIVTTNETIANNGIEDWIEEIGIYEVDERGNKNPAIQLFCDTLTRFLEERYVELNEEEVSQLLKEDDILMWHPTLPFNPRY